MPIYRATTLLEYGGPGSPGANVWHFRTVSDPSVTDAEFNAATGALVDFYTAILGTYPTGCKITPVSDVVRVTPGAVGQPDTIDDPPEGFSPSPQLTASSTGQAPEVLAILLGWRTTGRGASHRGRTFIGPVASAALDSSDGEVDGGDATAIKTAADAFIASFGGPDGWAFGVYSRTDKVLRDFTSCYVNPQWSYLSSRRD